MFSVCDIFKLGTSISSENTVSCARFSEILREAVVSSTSKGSFFSVKYYSNRLPATHVKRR